MAKRLTNSLLVRILHTITIPTSQTPIMATRVRLRIIQPSMVLRGVPLYLRRIFQRTITAATMALNSLATVIHAIPMEALRM